MMGGRTSMTRAAPRSGVVPLRIRHGDTELAFFGIVAAFGTPLDITVSELAIESFFPADAETAAVLREALSGPVPGTIHS